MNVDKLKQAEADFLLHYPGGFNHPEMVELGKKKHNVARLIAFSQEVFAEQQFARPALLLDNMVKVVSRSSMLSMFEKPRFRDFARSLSDDEREFFVDGFKERLFGDERSGFEMQLDLLATRKLAKWSLISVWPFYCKPNSEIFVKPTTTKKILQHLELAGLEYKPTPSWEFYASFRNYIDAMKKEVDDSLSPNNAAFTGFLMMSL